MSTSKAAFTAGPWEYVPGTEHHGPYVAGPWGGDICDCYAMSNPMAASVRNGGTSFPINHQGESAEANAQLIAEAGTVAHETGLTPRQLAERCKELEAALSDLAVLFERMGALHPSRDLREVLADSAGLAVRTRAAIAKAQEGGAN